MNKLKSFLEPISYVVAIVLEIQAFLKFSKKAIPFLLILVYPALKKT